MEVGDREDEKAEHEDGLLADRVAESARGYEQRAEEQGVCVQHPGDVGQRKCR
jgi:hypothetical protein